MRATVHLFAGDIHQTFVIVFKQQSLGFFAALGVDPPGRGQDAVVVLEEAGEEFRRRTAGKPRGRIDRDRIVAGGQNGGADAVVVEDAEAGTARRRGCRAGPGGQERDEQGQGSEHRRNELLHQRQPSSGLGAKTVSLSKSSSHP